METTPLPVLVLKDFSITVDGATYSGRKGEIVELPLWIGRALEEVEFVGLKATDVKTYLFQEGGLNLARIPQNLYEAARMTRRDDKDFTKAFIQLLDKRVEKIAFSAAFGSIGREAVHEERVLFARLASVIEEWKSKMRKEILGEHDEV